jgi:hypothetical protein
MAKAVDPIAQGAIFQCYLDSLVQRKLTASRGATELARELKPSLGEKVILSAMYRGLPKDGMVRHQLVEAAYKILARTPDSAVTLYQSPATVRFLTDILSEGTRHDSKAEHPQDNADKIFANWRIRSQLSAELLQSGLYQVFSRYKPTRQSAGGQDDEDQLGHAVVVELIYFNMQRYQAWFVTSEGDKYSGTFRIDHHRNMFAVFQRQPIDTSDQTHRFFAMELQSKSEKVVSGLLMKIDDPLFRPLAAETILLRIPRSFTSVHSAFMKEVIDSPSAHKIPTDSVLFEYTTDPPPGPNKPTKPEKDWDRVRYVHQIPPLKALVENRSSGNSFLREPSRAIGISAIHGVRFEWEVFRQTTTDGAVE